MSISLLNSFGIRIDQQLEYHSSLLSDTVLLVGDSVYTPNNPKQLPVYWTKCLEVVKEFKRLGGDPRELHEIKRTWPEAKLELHHHMIPYWDHSKLPTVTAKSLRTTAIDSVFRSQESLSKQSIKIIEDIRKNKRLRRL